MFCRVSRSVFYLGRYAEPRGCKYHSSCSFRQCQTQTSLPVPLSLRLKSAHIVPRLFALFTGSRAQLGEAVTSRFLSTSSRFYDQKNFELNAGPFGHLALHTVGSVDTEIKCLDPQKYPLQNKVLICVHSEDVELGKEDVQVEQNNTDIKLIIRSNFAGKSISCFTSLPIKFDIEADIKDRGNISVQKFENDDINIKTENGTCHLKNIQTGTVNLESQNGDVSCDGVIQGNSSIKATGRGNVKVHRIQGLTFQVETECGDIEAKALYADNTEMTTATGNVHIGACHRHCSITATKSGNVKIDSLDGNLSVHTNSGAVTVGYIARHEAVNIVTNKGNVDLKLSESQKTKFDVEASEVTLSNDFNVVDRESKADGDSTHLTGVLIGGAAVEDRNADILGNTQRHLEVCTRDGNVSISCADWFSSLQLMTVVE